MPSKARIAFDKNSKDIELLLKIHEQKGGSLRGRRYQLEVLNKSAVVLITSFWEAYCEDIAAEGLAHLVKYAESADNLPKRLKKQIAEELKKDSDELALWSVADEGWKKLLNSRLNRLQEERNRKLNTPKSQNIDQLFQSAVGIIKISDSWKWSPTMNPNKARTKLDKYIALRGSIAHRGNALKTVTKSQVVDYFNFIKNLASTTGGKVNQHVKEITGIRLWKRGN